MEVGCVNFLGHAITHDMFSGTLEFFTRLTFTVTQRKKGTKTVTVIVETCAFPLKDT